MRMLVAFIAGIYVGKEHKNVIDKILQVKSENSKSNK